MTAFLPISCIYFSVSNSHLWPFLLCAKGNHLEQNCCKTSECCSQEGTEGCLFECYLFSAFPDLPKVLCYEDKIPGDNSCLSWALARPIKLSVHPFSSNLTQPDNYAFLLHVFFTYIWRLLNSFIGIIIK